MYVTNWRVAVSSARWLICHNRMPQNNNNVAIGIVVFDFELNRWSFLVNLVFGDFLIHRSCAEVILSYPV